MSALILFLGLSLVTFISLPEGPRAKFLSFRVAVGVERAVSVKELKVTGATVSEVIGKAVVKFEMGTTWIWHRVGVLRVTNCRKIFGHCLAHIVNYAIDPCNYGSLG